MELPEPRAPGQQFLSVDFVTALTVEECEQRLRCCDEVLGQQVTLGEDGSFSVRRSLGERGDVRFWGTLQATERGTWVWGTIFQKRQGRWHIQPWLASFAVVVLVLMALDALRRGANQVALTWAIVLILLALLGGWRWYRRYRHGLRLVAWIYEVLYVRPKTDSGPAQTPPEG